MDFAVFLDCECFVQEFSNVTRIKKFVMQPCRFIRKHSEGDPTMKVCHLNVLINRTIKAYRNI